MFHRLCFFTVASWIPQNSPHRAVVTATTEAHLRQRVLAAVVPDKVVEVEIQGLRPISSAPVFHHQSWSGKTTVLLLSNSREPSFLYRSLAWRMGKEFRFFHLCLRCLEPVILAADSTRGKGLSPEERLRAGLGSLAERLYASPEDSGKLFHFAAQSPVAPLRPITDNFLPFLTPNILRLWYSRLEQRSRLPRRGGITPQDLLLVQREPSSPVLLLDAPLSKLLHLPDSVTGPESNPQSRRGGLAELIGIFRSPVLPELTPRVWLERFEKPSGPVSTGVHAYLSAVMRTIPPVQRIRKFTSGSDPAEEYWSEILPKPEPETSSPSSDPRELLVLSRSWHEAWEEIVRPLLLSSEDGVRDPLLRVCSFSSPAAEAGSSSPWCQEYPGIRIAGGESFWEIRPVWLNAASTDPTVSYAIAQLDALGDRKDCRLGVLLYSSELETTLSALCLSHQRELPPRSELLRNWLAQTVSQAQDPGNRSQGRNRMPFPRHRSPEGTSIFGSWGGLLRNLRMDKQLTDRIRRSIGTFGPLLAALATMVMTWKLIG